MRRFQVSDNRLHLRVLQLSQHVKVHRYVHEWQLRIHCGTSSSGEIRILQCTPERKGGGTEVVGVHLFVVALHLMLTLFLGNSLLTRKILLCPRTRQLLIWSSFDSLSSSFIFFLMGLTKQSNSTLSVESLLSRGVIFSSVGKIPSYTSS